MHKARKRATQSATAAIGRQAELLSAQLQSISEALFPPASQKALRKFTSGEAARLIGISDSTLRKMSLAGEGPAPEIGPGGRRLYSLGQITQLRERLAAGVRGRDDARIPAAAPSAASICRCSRSPISRAARARPRPPPISPNIWRCAAIACSPSTSTRRRACRRCSASCRKSTSGANETLYAAIRYDDQRRPLSRRGPAAPISTALDLVPGNLELMEFEHDDADGAMRHGDARPGRSSRRIAAALDSRSRPITTWW